MGYLAGALLAATPTVPGSRRNWLLLSLVMSSLTTGGMAFASSTAAFLTLRFAGGVASAFVLVLASALVLDRLSAAGRPDLAAVHAFACGIEAVGVAASVLWLTPAGVLLAAALLGGTFMGITALGLVRARCLSSGDPRRTLAVMTAAFGLGQIVGPAFAGVIYDATGTFLVPSLAAASALLAGALLALRGST
jgi:predicted MFS family arabinose efflux permease